jgi:ligand-binding SRPBCC domain-containing protein
MAQVYRFEEVVVVPAPLSEVFAYLRQPNNLLDIMPKDMKLEVAWPKDKLLNLGDEFTTKMRKNGLPVTWRSRVTHFEQDISFTDIQLGGPFRRWDHTHTVKSVSQGTEVRDEILIEMPLGVLGQFAMWLFVRADLQRTFDHRRAQFLAAFGVN